MFNHQYSTDDDSEDDDKTGITKGIFQKNKISSLILQFIQIFWIKFVQS
jgi:hypothetical protein